MAGASIWTPGSKVVPSMGVENPRVTQVFTVTSSVAGALFNLTEFEYVPGSKSLVLYLNGQRLHPGAYAEQADGKSFTITNAISAVSEILAEGTVARYSLLGELDKIKAYAETKINAQVTALGFEAPVTYNTAGQTLLRATQLVTVTGNSAIYAPALGTVYPFTTSGTFNPLLWRVVVGNGVADTLTQLALTTGAAAVGTATSTLWTTVQGFINWCSGKFTTLAEATGSTLVGHTQPGSAVLMDMSAFLNFGLLISPRSFGCVGDGVTDDTVAMQACLNYGATNKLWIHGGGKKYRVSTVYPKSGQRALALNLESIGPLTTGAISFQPVIDIRGVGTKLTDMHFIECTANGRRDLFTNIWFAAGEDGGMHAWRVSFDDAGGVEDILWENCNGIAAGTAGLAIHHVTPGTTATYPAKNLKWLDGKLTGNREHGWFADGFKGLTVKDADCRGNGTDLNTTDPLEHGNRGARSTGLLFGAGFDVECYGPMFMGSLWTDITLEGLDCRDCAAISGFYSNIDSSLADFVTPTNIQINKCILTKGVTTTDGIPFRIQGNPNGTVPAHTNVSMLGNYMDGSPRFNGVVGLVVDGGYIKAVGNKALVYNCQYYSITAPSSAYKIDVFPAITPVFTRASGTPAATLAIAATKVLTQPNAAIKLECILTLTGALAAGGDLVYTIPSPLAGYTITEATASCQGPIYTAITTCTTIEPSNGLCTFIFDTVNGVTMYATVSITLSPNDV